MDKTQSNQALLIPESITPGERTAIFDIDGTIADTSKRIHYILHKPKNYNAFHSACVNDSPIEATINVLELVADNSLVFFVTGRNNAYRDITIEWIKKHTSLTENMFVLLMREDKDNRKDYIIKKEYLDAIRKSGYHVMFAVEDRNQVKRMYVENGVFVFDVNQTGEEF